MKTDNNLVEQVTDVLLKLGVLPTILNDCNSNEELQKKYEEYRPVFNRKFQFRPTVIVLVENEDQISALVKLSNGDPENIILRLRSGGHDHEGECSGTDTLLLDFSEMYEVDVTDEKVISGNNVLTKISIEPGARFKYIKGILDDAHLGIPHGTCETVAIAGYTMGGGWGPWTRRYGMACESLTGARLVLGNGDVVEVSHLDDPDSNEGKLLWALRGGGGMSYGIVTKLFFNAFTLPDLAFSFSVKFNQPASVKIKRAITERIEIEAVIEYQIDMPAIEVLKRWEGAIKPDANPNLIGTNLKIETVQLKATELDPNPEPDPNAYLKCAFNGYYGGKEEDLSAFILKHFGAEAAKGLSFSEDRVLLDGKAKNASEKYEWHFESWDRESAPSRSSNEFNPVIALEPDGPAPHKITSRLADEDWGKDARIALINSLQSTKIPDESDSSMEQGVKTYITLGAISGAYYNDYDNRRDTLGSAFPYKNRLFTIQYQTWWNQFLNSDREQTVSDEKRKEETITNRKFYNRAEDWMEDCRDAIIPNTGGAFISFKDSSIPTSTYFGDSYKKLMEIKLSCSKDENFLLQTRKTII